MPCAAVAINAATEVRVSDRASYEVTVFCGSRARARAIFFSESLLSPIALTLSQRCSLVLAADSVDDDRLPCLHFSFFPPHGFHGLAPSARLIAFFLTLRRHTRALAYASITPPRSLLHSTFRFLFLYTGGAQTPVLIINQSRSSFRFVFFLLFFALSITFALPSAGRWPVGDALRHVALLPVLADGPS